MSVKSMVLLGTVILVASPGVAMAQEAGDGYVKVAAARTKLVDKGEVRSNGVLDPQAGYSTRETWHGVVTLGYFPIDGIAFEGSVSTPATTNNLPAGSLAGVPNLGDDEFVVLTSGITVQPFKGPVSPYVGGGIALQITTQQRDGLAVGLNITNSHGPYLKAGVDFALSNRFALFADVRKSWYNSTGTGLLPLDATFTNFAAINARAVLDPVTVQLGGVVRFGPSADADGVDFSAPGGDWIVRAGLTSLRLRDSAEMVVGGAPLTGEGISTFEHKTPSIQVGRRIAGGLSVNATVGVPPTIPIYAAGTIGGLPKLGEATYGPTAFTLQYQFNRQGRFRPYVGAGASYMIVFDTKDGAFEDLQIDNDLAPAFEVGTDLMVDNGWGLFVDVKKALLRPGVRGTFQGNSVDAQAKLDPWVFSGGVSFNF